MPTRLTLISIVLICLAIASIALSAVALRNAGQLSLPLPTSLPAVSIALPVLSMVMWPIALRIRPLLQKHALRILLPYLAYGSTLAPFVLLILSMVYGHPSDMQSCAADRQWLRMFEHKDADGIRGIQSRLQCCGYNSVRDRAWPFPSRGVDAGACVRTLGYNVPCAGQWHQQETNAAGLTAIANLLTWIMTIVLINAFPEHQNSSTLPRWSDGHPRLITDTDDAVVDRHVQADSVRDNAQEYTDEAQRTG